MTEEHKEEIAELIDRLLDGSADDATRERLKDLLRDNDDVQEYYVEYCQLHAMLTWEHGGMPPVDFEKREITNTISVVNEAFTRSVRRWQSLAIATSLMFLASAAWLIYDAVTEPASPSAKTTTTDSVRENFPTGVLLLADNPVWHGADAPASLGEPVFNTALILNSGNAQIALFGGAIINLQGPCHLDLESDSRVYLRHGDLVVSIHDDHTELAVDTPVGELLHLGTEFGVSVAESGDTEMYVFDGAVEVKQDSHGLPAGSARIFRAGAATRLAASGRVEDLGGERYKTFRLNHPPLTNGIEFKPLALTVDEAGFRVRYMKVDNELLKSLAAADAVLAGRVSAVQDTIVEGVPLIDFQDHSEGEGEEYLNVFAPEEGFPGDNNGRLVNDEHFLIRATATFVVQDAWRYTFLVNVDDGARLRIDGKDVIVDDGIHPPQVSLGTVLLTPGRHTLELIAYDDGGFARVELGYAAGETNNVEDFVPLSVSN